MSGRALPTARAAVIAAFALLLPAVALIGPAKVREWIFPAADELATAKPEKDPAEEIDLGALAWLGQGEPVRHATAHPGLADESPLDLRPPADELASYESPAADLPPALESPVQRLPEVDSVAPDAETPIPGDGMAAHLERRLRDCGAFHLELTTTTRGPRFVYRCWLPPLARHGRPLVFEAADNEPLEAMRRVASDVASWRASLAGEAENRYR